MYGLAFGQAYRPKAGPRTRSPPFSRQDPSPPRPLGGDEGRRRAFKFCRTEQPRSAVEESAPIHQRRRRFPVSPTHCEEAGAS